jgi:hypothetical protein
MKYYFVFEKSQEDIPTLIVYRDDGVFMFGASPRVVNVITGERAIQLFNELTEKAKEES